MATYTGAFNNTHWYQVFKNGQLFSHKHSYKYVKHSPDGFSWGYNGSGPSQLAFGLLLEETHDVDLSMKLYQKFKQEIISALPLEGGWILTSDNIDKWILNNKE